MLGTGTQLDPYQITTVAEFRSMNNSNAYYKLMNDLDVNDSEWASNWTQAWVEFLEFDGDGHEIRNIVMSDMEDNSLKGGILSTEGSNSDRLITIKNTKFINVVMQGASGSFFNYIGSNLHTNVDFIKCNFSITCNFTSVSSDYLLIAHLRLSAKLDQCSLLISGVCGRIHGVYTSSGRETINCMWLLDINANLSSGVANIFGSSYIKNSIRGKINFVTKFTTIFRYALSQCYVACDIQAVSTLVRFSSSTIGSTCFCDSELSTVAFEEQANLYALTTAQCKDKDYLNSIGFTVV